MLQKMKKLLLMLLFIPLFGYSQKVINKPAVLSHPQTNMMKIGNLEVGDSLALEYLADCYIHPDIFYVRPFKKVKESDKKIDIKDIAVGEYGERFYPRENYEYNDSLRRLSIRWDYDNIYVTYFYRIPRTPSDIDFVKWIHSIKK